MRKGHLLLAEDQFKHPPLQEPRSLAKAPPTRAQASSGESPQEPPRVPRAHGKTRWVRCGPKLEGNGVIGREEGHILPFIPGQEGSAA